MKKFLVILIAICMLASVLCITAFAAESTAVMKVQYGSEVKEFSNFEDGWNFAMEQANDEKEVYVTLLADWIAEDGQFTDNFFNGAGFDYDTIYFANDVTMTLDLNGHTIDRGLTASEANGEVMFINDDANVTIKNGTIKGGYSSNGAGGIHIEGANVKLIDLIITGNHVVDDDGTALQHVDGGELYMKNCRFVDNDGSSKGFDIYGMVYLNGVDKVLIEDCYFADTENVDYGAGIYADECIDFVIKNSTFENLHAGDRGGAIWFAGESLAEGGASGFYIYNCKFNNNSCGNYGGAIYTKVAEPYVYDTEFNGNYSDGDGGAVYLNVSGMENNSIPAYFYRCTFDGNRAGVDGGAIYCNSGMSVLSNAQAYGCDFINNAAGEYGGAVCIDTDCNFGFFSDVETGKVGTIKNNSAGELGGGVYQGSNATVDFGGEIYASGNVSSAGNDDIYLKSGYYCEVQYSITSPDGSIGIYFKNAEGGRLVNWKDENITVNHKAFFFNNGEFDLKFEQTQENSMGYKGPLYILRLVKKAPAVGSMLGEGSLTMIVALLALITSGVCIFLIVDMKKKLVPVAANNATEADEE